MTESITSYFQSIFIIALTGAITETLLSTTANNSKTLESGLKLVFSLCLFLSVVIPAADLLKNTEIPHLSDTMEISLINDKEYGIIEMTKRQMEKDISGKIYSKFGIKPEYVCIEFVTEQDENSINVNIENVQVGLSNEHVEHQNQITNYVNELVGINNDRSEEQ